MSRGEISEMPVSRSDCKSRVFPCCTVSHSCSVQGLARELTSYSVASKGAGSW